MCTVVTEICTGIWFAIAVCWALPYYGVIGSLMVHYNMHETSRWVNVHPKAGVKHMAACLMMREADKDTAIHAIAR